ncbi:AlpA family transcriptional regulator [Beijerinckia sp. L45]|uniref:helix-turn-helix transcriptional regulator n=1 Tax=Beijerinckia sp. L45 TaxID=1641855 RepID=UPI00131B6EA3|nr:hypothetical protein [Beijerinckia sp. L45]
MNVTPRLLNKAQAAAYCGLSEAAFPTLCNVRPIELGTRMLRYDVKQLDKWIDSLSPDANPPPIDWMQAYDDDVAEKRRAKEAKLALRKKKAERAAKPPATRS